MPTYQGQISEEGVIALVEYIKNLDSGYRIQQALNSADLPPGSEGLPRSIAQAAAETAGQRSAAQQPATQGMVKQ
jgi:cytochrome c oxidase subunit 2